MAAMPAVGVKLNAPIRELTWDGIREVALAAEAGPFDSLWTEDHHFGPREWTGRGGDAWDSWTTLAALAAVTSRVRLGTIVASLNFTSPLLLARKAATVHHISGGRLILGVGAGSMRAEYPKLGVPHDHPVSRFQEAFEVVRRLLAGERFTFSGDYWELDDTWLAGAPEPDQQPEIMLGSNGPRMLRHALPRVDGWNVHWGDDDFYNDPVRFATLNARIDRACEEAGRDPGSVWRSCEIYVQMTGAHGLPLDVPDDFPIARGRQAVSDLLGRLAEAGADRVQVLVDPQTPRAVEELAAAVDGAGSTG